MKGFKIIVLHEVDSLTREAQAALRRTMEKYVGSCRLILSCNSLTKVMAPIRSRCLSLRIPSPEENDIKRILDKIKKAENKNLSNDQIDKIVNTCDNNLRRAITMLELSNFILTQQLP
jgi:replication factor C subunit 3/5